MIFNLLKLAISDKIDLLVFSKFYPIFDFYLCEKIKIIIVILIDMKKTIILSLFSFAFLSCTNTIKSEPKFELPKFAVSKENLTSKITEADSASVEMSYEAKTNLLFSSSANKLVIKVYFNKDKSLKYEFMKSQFEDIKKNAKQQVLNLSSYDILEVQFFNKNIQIQRFKEILKK